MRSAIGPLLAVACVAVGPLGAQVPAAHQSAPSVAAMPPLTLTGCVKQDDGTYRLMLADEAKSGRYELTGSDARPYLGKRVQVKGVSRNRLHFAGGLWPSANVAAQAGALDPARAATAALPGGGSGGNGSSSVLEFRVASVRILKGTCP